MMLIGDRLGFDVPDKFVMDQAKGRAEKIVKQAQRLRERLSPRNATVTPADADDDKTPESHQTTGPLPGIGETPPATVSAELVRAIGTTMQRSDGAKRWWQWFEETRSEKDPDKRDEIFVTL
jgi:hypothetical protein